MAELAAARGHGKRVAGRAQRRCLQNRRGTSKHTAGDGIGDQKTHDQEQLARAGEQDAAVALLEKLSSEAPSVGPATLARDPLIATPLRNNERYQKLRTALELESGANRAALRSREE